ncbi:MAG: beta-mannanase [Chloroflexota bacterium]|nr:beta-mannanase [Chloroflexota bacterium]
MDTLLAVAPPGRSTTTSVGIGPIGPLPSPRDPGVTITSNTPAPYPQVAQSTPMPSSAVPIALGAYVSPGAWGTADIDQFTGLVGSSPAIIMWYQDWAHLDMRDFDLDRMNAVVQRGAVPVITWEPWDDTGNETQPAYALSRIVDGTYDFYIRGWAHAAATWRNRLYLRFAHEMNADWYPWSSGVNGNTSAQYIAAWRHVWDIFHQEGATNVRWIWSPNVEVPGSTPYAEVYPGDTYVDWIGLDGYNWGTSQAWSRWMDFTAIFGVSYEDIEQLTNKPIMIAETACADSGGDKAAWILHGLLTDVPTRFPRIRAVVWFDIEKETDWRIDSSPSSLAAFSRVAASPMYRGRLP